MKGFTALLSFSVVLALSAQAAAPEQVLVVKTGDDSVSLVDLATLREVKRFEVGKSPYGLAITRDGQTIAVGIEGMSAPHIVKYGPSRKRAFVTCKKIKGRLCRDVTQRDIAREELASVAISQILEPPAVSICALQDVLPLSPASRTIKCARVPSVCAASTSV